jgi:hypothetical protein
LLLTLCSTASLTAGTSGLASMAIQMSRFFKLMFVASALPVSLLHFLGVEHLQRIGQVSFLVCMAHGPDVRWLRTGLDRCTANARDVERRVGFTGQNCTLACPVILLVCPVCERDRILEIADVGSVSSHGRAHRAKEHRETPIRDRREGERT